MYGIHWHIANPVEFITNGEDKQEIRWVRTTLPDGRTVEYNDVTNPLSPEEIAAGREARHGVRRLPQPRRPSLPGTGESDPPGHGRGPVEHRPALCQESICWTCSRRLCRARKQALAAVATTREQLRRTTYPEAAPPTRQEIDQADRPGQTI